MSIMTTTMRIPGAQVFIVGDKIIINGKPNTCKIARENSMPSEELNGNMFYEYTFAETA